MKHPIKIMQIGDGNFIRGFFDLAVEKLQVPCSIVSVAATARGKTVKLLEEQQLQFTVMERGLKNGEVVEEETTVKIIQDTIHPYENWPTFLQYAQSETLEMIVSNTTEAGIYYENIPYPTACPTSYAAKLTVFLEQYYKHFQGEKQVAIVPLELIEQNGSTLKTICLQHAKDWKLPTAFNDWLATLTFCNTLVDRIVTGYPQDYQGEDALYTVCEPYFLFVIDQKEPFKHWPTSHDFPFVFDDLDMYRKRKVAILNGSHILLSAFGKIFNYKTVREAFSHAGVRAFIEKITNDFTQRFQVDEYYQQDVFERFLNPFIEHQLYDIQLNELSKWQTRIAPYAETEIYYQALAIGIYAMNPTRFSVRESDQIIEKLTEIHNYFEQGQSEPMQQFIEQYFQCDAAEVIQQLSTITSLLEAIACDN
ncbi:hypothetical protein NY607_16270 [Lysinibacillus sp. A4]|uniref:mannitol dehydrogenase family protein n=1 Tax=unclassified Lysinibacillus TaxID=2636778 RepID=UPI001EDA1CE7|nr:MULTISPECIES: hypothetical protein [unclassified Lysinibacillus]MCS5502683.1 hypothetical protein [Lysinibacillus sp. A4]UKJ45271.1 hypothetical protein L6W14_21735 [Lysinibacillus sp. ACHW1.5]